MVTLTPQSETGSTSLPQLLPRAALPWPSRPPPALDLREVQLVSMMVKVKATAARPSSGARSAPRGVCFWNPRMVLKDFSESSESWTSGGAQGQV
eukprot:5125017-Pyramimonas_sp.AAC.1